MFNEASSPTYLLDEYRIRGRPRFDVDLNNTLEVLFRCFDDLIGLASLDLMLCLREEALWEDLASSLNSNVFLASLDLSEDV